MSKRANGHAFYDLLRSEIDSANAFYAKREAQYDEFVRATGLMLIEHLKHEQRFDNGVRYDEGEG